MNSSIIGKIEKAKRYAAEPERVQITALGATFHGSHDEYTLTFQDGAWHCSCHFFESQDYGTCSHVMALQRQASRRLAFEQLAHLIETLRRDVEDPRRVGEAERRSSREEDRHQVPGEGGVGDFARVQQHQGRARVGPVACAGVINP